GAQPAGKRTRPRGSFGGSPAGPHGACDISTMSDTERALTDKPSLEAVYVRHGNERLAAILTVPRRPRGLVALLQGFGATRSHRNRLWTWISDDLAGRGMATVRFDYPGMGDSTGDADWDLNDPPTD